MDARQPLNTDYLIVGGGPAGLQAACVLERRGRDSLLAERGDGPGTFFRTYPRHRRLNSYNKRYTGFDDPEINLRWDWNSLLSGRGQRFTEFSDDLLPGADDFVRYLEHYATTNVRNIRYGTCVRRIGRAPDGRFLVDTTDGPITARSVLLGTGLSTPHVPFDLPGAEYCESYATANLDPVRFRNKRVMIVGKGNSGFELAADLLPVAASVHMISPDPISLAWKSHQVGDLRSFNTHTLDMYQLKMQSTILDADITSIAPRPGGGVTVDFRYCHADGQQWQLPVDVVILCTGFAFDTSILAPELRPELTHGGRFPAMTHEWESTSSPGLFYIGTLMQSRDHKRSFSGFVHGFRYNVCFLERVLAARFHDEPITPDRVNINSARALRESVIERSIRASSLFQLPAFNADAYMLADGATHRYVDIPVDYLFGSGIAAGRTVVVHTLEYGNLGPGDDPFNVARDPADGTTSKFIHPVIRVHSGDGQLLDEYHVPEDLENRWDDQRYERPLEEYLLRALGSVLG